MTQRGESIVIDERVDNPPKSPLWLLKYRCDRYSQGGEDGVIGKALETLLECDRWCVEFGAGNGLDLSNTRALIEDGYSAVLIESDKATFRRLAQAYAGNKAVTTVNRFVGWKGDSSLDSILAATSVPHGFDLLSIDIDGNDYHTWRAMEAYQPKLLLIEFNPTIPSHVRFVQQADPAVAQGAGLLSLVELGKSKGYELICVFGWNVLFVREDCYPCFGMTYNMPNLLRTELGHLTWLYVGYDGTVFIDGNLQLPWHQKALIEQRRMQVLPGWLRKPVHKYSWLQRRGYDVLTGWRENGLRGAWAATRKAVVDGNGGMMEQEEAINGTEVRAGGTG